MRFKTLFVAPLAAFLIGAAAPAAPATDDAAANRVRAHVEFLADDLLEGRATGERGHAIAAAYVASHFRSLGLQPGGEDGSWYAEVPFRRASHAGPVKATLTAGGERVELEPGKDIAIAPSLTERERSADVALVFVGRGIADPELGVDDYRGLDVRGKMVVALAGTPKGTPTEVAAHLSATKADMAAAKGAIGYIEIGSEPGQGSYGYRMSRYSKSPAVDWVDSAGAAGGTPKGLRFNAAVSASIADRLFEGASKSLAKVRAQAAKRSGTVRGFPLKARLSLQASSTWEDFTSPEVIGLLPGSDPQLRDQYVVLMGHLDHLGMKKDAEPGEDAIYNGALDNAAGVATMLEAAHEFVASGKPPRRSVLFIANTGEELGLVGADYFAAHPTVPIDKIVGAVDLDMPVPLYAFTDVVAFGADHSTVVDNVEQAAKSMGMTVSPDPMPEQSIFVRSDHYQFVKRGVPAILLFTGYGNGGKAKWDDFFANIYHSPRDDLSQPINWNAAARYAELNYRISRALADADQRPLWYKNDYFGDSFAPAQPKANW